MTRYAKAKGRVNSLERKRDCHVRATHTANMSISLLNNWTPRMTSTADRLNKALLAEMATPKPKRRRDLCSARRKAKAEERKAKSQVKP